MFADLHLHTCFSDGTYTPEELVGHGRRLGFRALALTDHDTVEGCARMAAACREAGLDFLPACEFTAEIDEHELHLLGYCLDIGHARLLEELQRFQLVRQNRIREMVARLNGLGVPVEADAVFALANCRSPGRPHLARMLVRLGQCSSLDEAFERFLKRGRPAWVPKRKMSALDAIRLIHQAGGVAVLAHPGLTRIDEIIPKLVAAGLDGLECFHTKHSTATSEHYLEMADRHRLLVTGGSDCHGMNKGRPLIGTIKLPITHVERLRARVAERAAAVAPAS
ncbi:MAG TPA: PHP domain-containing protein [Methylomirabilota bacterium]|nr:PHP domain-containing protein [Methylomirabilota bacterium]